MPLLNHKNSKILKILTNKFVLFFLVFLIWMLFFDKNSYLVHRQFNKEIEELENTITFYKDKIEKDKQVIKKLEDSLQLEKFAREQYLMKKNNEVIYLVEFDTLNKND